MPLFPRLLAEPETVNGVDGHLLSVLAQSVGQECPTYDSINLQRP